MRADIYLRQVKDEPFILRDKAAQTFVDKFINEKGTFITVTSGNQSAVLRREEISAVIVNKEDGYK